MKPSNNTFLAVILMLSFLSASCRTTQNISKNEQPLFPVDASIAEIVAAIPNYNGLLTKAAGKARAAISEPGNSERITLSFETDETLSLLTFKNRIGIEGGQLLVDPDSILIYDKTEQIAQKVSASDGRLSGINELASLNFLDLLNFKVNAGSVKSVMQNDSEFVLLLKNKGTVYISKKNGTVNRVEQPPRMGLPYSEIEYDSYAVSNEFTLPRKITIFSSDKTSRVSLQILNLEVNPAKMNLELRIPKNILIERP